MNVTGAENNTVTLPPIQRKMLKQDLITLEELKMRFDRPLTEVVSRPEQ